MKLSKLFVIALLAGTLGVFGCSDDEPQNGNGGSGGNGNGGSGGTAADACTSGDCADSSSDVQTACGEVKTFCNSDDCCTLPGTGGTGGTMTVDPDSDTCDDVGQVACILGAGGAGGTGGTGGDGGGGTGGTGATCDDFTGQEVCSLCTVDNLKPACEDAFADCLVATYARSAPSSPLVSLRALKKSEP
jgi:hypothetical protein